MRSHDWETEGLAFPPGVCRRVPWRREAGRGSDESRSSFSLHPLRETRLYTPPKWPGQLAETAR